MNGLARRTVLFQLANSKTKRVSRCHLNKSIHSRQYSSAQSGLQESSYDFEIKNLGPRNLKKKPPIRPFLKDIFSSDFNKDLLAFPEILDKAGLEDLAHKVSVLDNIMSEKATSDELLKTLKTTKLLALPASYSQGGYEAVLTERCKILETLSKDPKTARYIKNHWLGMTSVKTGLPQEHVDGVMFDLISGKHPIAVCLQEKIPNSPNMVDLNCKAESNIDNEWSISGTKICKSDENGYFIVACSVQHEPIQLFLVRPGASGVSINASDASVSFKNTPALHLGSDLEFINTPELSDVVPFMKDAIAMSRVEVSAIAAGILRNAIRDTVSALRRKYICGRPAGEYQLIESAVSNAVSSLYAIESMVYFTAGLYDGYENSDIEVEACVCQYYATQKAFDSINYLMKSVGMNMLAGDFFEYARDAQSLLLDEEHVDQLVVYGGLLALQHTAQKYAEDVKKVRNPFFNPNFLLKKLLKDRKHSKDNPDLDLHLEENLHPSLQFSSKDLEYCVVRMGYITEHSFIKFGSNISDEHKCVRRLFDIICEIYAMTASLSRASRAYCIGLHMGENELLLSNTLTVFGVRKVKEIIAEIEDGVYLNQDAAIQDLATKTMARGSSHFEHCLERVYF